jgi:hypothetical protein
MPFLPKLSVVAHLSAKVLSRSTASNVAKGTMISSFDGNSAGEAVAKASSKITTRKNKVFFKP